MRGNRPKWAGRRWLIWFSGVIVIVITLMTFWWHAISRTPDIQVPMPVMPVPNAHDDFVAAGQALVNGNRVAYAPQTVHTGANPDDHPYTLAQKEALLQQNAQALRLLQKGLNETYWAPPARSVNARFPSYGLFRNVMRLLALEENVRAQAGDWRGAMESGLDCLQFGVQIPHGAVLIGRLYGNAFEEDARRPLWDVVDHLSAPEARAAARRLEGILAQRFPYSGTLQEEKWMVQASLQEMFHRANWRHTVTNASVGTGGGWSGLREIGIFLFVMLRGGPRGIVATYTHHMDAMIARARLPYGAHAPMPKSAADPINQMLAPVFTQAEFKDAKTQTEDDLLLLTLALRAYRLEHGRYPDTLEALAPDYLAAIPQDPFARSGTLRYRLKGDKALVYSVGPDGVDNGGTAVDDPTRINALNSRTRHVVDEQSLGDIVAGINR